MNVKLKNEPQLSVEELLAAASPSECRKIVKREVKKIFSAFDSGD